MDPKIILLIVCLTTFTSGAQHNPRVHEDQIEKESGSVRNIRNPHAKQKVAALQPPTFNFRMASQQDLLKNRYAQQQKFDFKNELRMRGPAANEYRQGRDWSNLQPEQSEVHEDWQPFQPRITKQTPERQSKMQTSASKETVIVNKTATRSEQKNTTILKEMDTSSSEATIEKQDINRQDGPPLNFDGEIVYVQPSILKQLINENGAINNPNSIGGVPDLKYNALNDLVGKNPNYQLEGLKQILMQEVPRNSPTYPVIQGPKPFKPKDHTPIVEKSIDIPNPQSRPNIQVNHEEAPPPAVAALLQQSPVISQNSLESLQKQLDEASNIEAQKAWEKATQDSKAHVEAQHKAIEDAQKAILQKFHFNENPEALALIQKELPAYAQPSNYQTAVEQNVIPFYPTPQPELQNEHQVLKQSQSNAKLPTPVNYLTQNNNEEVFRVNIPTEHDAAPVNYLTQNNNEEVFRIHVPTEHDATPVQEVSKPRFIPTRSKPLHRYPSKNVEFYAPNHRHQAVSQLQAEEAVVAQVESQNSAILNNHKKLSNAKRVFKDVPKVVDTFQQIVFDQQDSGKAKNLHKKSAKQQDEDNDSQYAARYAFGYSVKDAKEGNDFGHQERRIGKSAEGSYYVVLPDGRKQNVKYYADTSGYHAKVTYEHAQHS